MRLCTGCKKVRYCDALCQKSDWRAGHRTTCKTGSTKQDTTLLAHPCGICKARDDDDPMRGRQAFCYRCGLLICGACRPLLEARRIERCPGCRGRPRVTDLKDLEDMRVLAGAGDMEDRCLALVKVELGAWLGEGRGVMEADKVAGIRALRDADEARCARASLSLAVCHATGSGVALMLARARAHCEVAAEAGFVDAQFSLGCLALDGGDDARAVAKLKQASRGGDVGAMIMLGELYEAGRGVRVDCGKAAALYRACELSQIAATHLGILHKDGRGVLQDGELAVRLLTMGAEGEAKLLEAQCELGDIYLIGDSKVARDAEKAEKLLGAAAAKSEPHSAYRLGCLLIRGMGDVLHDEPRAASCFRMAAKAGLDAAIFNLGSAPQSQNEPALSGPPRDHSHRQFNARRCMYVRGFLKSTEYPEPEPGVRGPSASLVHRAEPDKLRAARLWQQAADRGFAPAQKLGGVREPCGVHILVSAA